MSSNILDWQERLAHPNPIQTFTAVEARNFITSYIVAYTAAALRMVNAQKLVVNVEASMKLGGFPEDAWRAWQGVDMAQQRTVRSAIQKVFLPTATQFPHIPIVTLLEVLDKADAEHWLPFDILETKTRGIDLQQLVDGLPFWFLDPTITDWYPPYLLCLKATEIHSRKDFRAALNDGIQENRSCIERCLLRREQRSC